MFYSLKCYLAEIIGRFIIIHKSQIHETLLEPLYDLMADEMCIRDSSRRADRLRRQLPECRFLSGSHLKEVEKAGTHQAILSGPGG